MSKFLKQVVLAVMLLVPSNEVREMAAKGLGYQETAYATYILAHYLSAYADEWGHEYNNSLASAGRGILRNYDYRTVGHILKPMADTTTRDLLHEYFRCHFYRMLFPELEPGSRFSPDEQRQRVAKVISEMSRCLGDTINDEIRGYLEAQLREITDDHFQKQIELCDEKLRTTTKDDEKKKWAKARAWAVEELANRERQVPIERITAALQLLGPNRGTTNVPPSAAR
ncbi:MAG: hypothetical protein NTY53_24685 [Kiritimatiellaeota bacterium]|nr:hypothetical protein [Kiritimatiellota bacterium]